MNDYLTLPKQALSNDDVKTIEFILNHEGEVEKISRIYNPLERKTQHLCEIFQVSSIEEVLKAAIKYGLVNCKRDDSFKKAIFEKATKNYLSDIHYRQEVFNICYTMPQVVINYFNELHACIDVIDRKTFNKVAKELKENKQACEFFESLYKKFDFRNPISRIKFKSTIQKIVSLEYQEISAQAICEALQFDDCTGSVYSIAMYIRDYCPRTFFEIFSDEESNIIDFLLTQGDVFDAIEYFNLNHSSEYNLINAIIKQYNADSLNDLLNCFMIERQKTRPFLFFTNNVVQSRYDALKEPLERYSSFFNNEDIIKLKPLSKIENLRSIYTEGFEQAMNEFKCQVTEKIRTIKMNEQDKKHHALITTVYNSIIYAEELIRKIIIRNTNLAVQTVPVEINQKELIKK